MNLRAIKSLLVSSIVLTSTVAVAIGVQVPAHAATGTSYSGGCGIDCDNACGAQTCPAGQTCTASCGKGGMPQYSACRTIG